VRYGGAVIAVLLLVGGVAWWTMRSGPAAADSSRVGEASSGDAPNVVWMAPEVEETGRQAARVEVPGAERRVVRMPTSFVRQTDRPAQVETLSRVRQSIDAEMKKFLAEAQLSDEQLRQMLSILADYQQQYVLQRDEAYDLMIESTQRPRVMGSLQKQAFEMRDHRGLAEEARTRVDAILTPRQLEVFDMSAFRGLFSSLLTTEYLEISYAP
jgi:hypothetical protein